MLRVVRCDYCGREIVLIRMAKSGSVIGCDPDVISLEWGERIVTKTGRMVFGRHTVNNTRGRRPHIASCLGRQKRKMLESQEERRVEIPNTEPPSELEVTAR